MRSAREPTMLVALSDAATSGLYRARAVRFAICIWLIAGCELVAASECVVLLHGLARSSASMQLVADALRRDGLLVANVDYPSRRHKIERLAPLAVNRGLDMCRQRAASSIHFVTHSLGGILVRFYLAHNTIDQLGRIVMLAPPNQGSQVVDNWRDVPGFRMLNGPAGMQLGTGHESIPLALGPVDFALGVIAGSRTFNPILSLSLPNPDDGKVSVSNARVEGMTDFIVMPQTHTFIMRSEAVINQVRHFLRAGEFRHLVR